MKMLFFTFAASLAVAAAIAQTKPVTLTGTLTMKTGEIFPYKLVITDSGDYIKGYSLTYKEPGETKTTVRGRLDRHSRTLSFKEKDIIYSHNVSTKAFMCLVNASLEYVWDAGAYVLKGPATSRESDNTACTPGEIIFNDRQQLDNLFAYHEQFDTVITMKKRVGPAAPVAEKKPAEPGPAVTDKITAGAEKYYDWHSDTLIIDIWDGGHIDGDRITLEFNGKQYLTNYTLQREKKQLHIPITSHEKNKITILAENEGSEPPNTANIMLTDGAVKYNILAYNNKGDIAVINVKKIKDAKN